MTKRGLYKLAVGGCLAGYAWLFYSWAKEGSGVSACLFKRIYHIPCPACGSTRAVIEVFQGHLKEAFLLNPNGFLLAVGLLVLPIWLLYDGLFGKESLFGCYTTVDSLMKRNVFLGLFIFLVLLNWIWTIYKGG